jgi:hypothetical protein
MNHFASSSFNGRITINKGDTLTVVLHYECRPGQLTAWSFGDNFGFNAALSLGSIETKAGVRTMLFTAHSVGTVEIALAKSSVYGVEGPSSNMGSYKLTVTVV